VSSNKSQSYKKSDIHCAILTTDNPTIQLEPHLAELDSSQNKASDPAQELRVTQKNLLLTRRALEKVKKYFCFFYHDAPHGYVTLDQSGAILQANDTFAKHINLKLSHIENKLFENCILSEDKPSFKKLFKKFFASPEQNPIEVRLHSRNGTPKYVVLKGKKITDPDQKINLNSTEPVVLASVVDISQQKAREDEIRQLAFYDAITNLPNRRLFIERLKHTIAYCQRHNAFYAVICIGLDRFKHINDSLGHYAGDELLQQAATRLNRMVRHEDTVARLPGDEFVIILTNIGAKLNTAISNAERIADKLARQLAKPFHIKGSNVFISASVGISMFPVTTDDPEDILQQADQAMYNAKKEGRGQICFFHADMQKAANDLLNKEKAMQQAISNNEFFLAYQPKVNHNGEMLSLECLVRWDRPGVGIVQPDDFIPIAEQSGLIYEIWIKALNLAASQAKQWSYGVTISINVSAKVFHNKRFVPDVESLITSMGIPAKTLIFEVTESLALRQVDNIVDKMNSLSQLGIRFSLDDFGAGYSSLRYLQKLPLSEIKLDKHFIEQLNCSPVNDAIVDSVLILANKLELDLVAEGVETDQQFVYLKRQGCKIFQGFYFSKPCSAGEISKKYMCS